MFFVSLHSTVSDFLWPHGLQSASLPCPSLYPGVCSNSWPLSWRCHATIASTLWDPLLLLSIFPTIRVFSNELAVHIRQSKYWSFSFSISDFRTQENKVCHCFHFFPHLFSMRWWGQIFAIPLEKQAKCA